MKTMILAAGLLCATALQTQAQDQDKPYLTKSFAGQTITDADVETSGGSIRVEGVDAAQSRVEVYIRGNNGRDLSNDEIKDRLDKYYTVRIELNGGRLLVTARRKTEEHEWISSHNLSIAFRVYTPHSASTHLNTSGGGIRIAHLEGGKQVFQTSGGGLEVSDITGKIDGSTSGGGIHVDHCSDDIHLTTSGGGIHADHLKGTIFLETSGGGLTLNNLSGKINAGTSGGGIQGGMIDGDLKTSTSGGSIDLDDMSCTLDASTSGGGIRVSMNALGKYVKLSSSAGSVSLSIPAGKGLDLTLDANHIDTEGLGSFNGTKERDHMRGTVNGGGIPIEVNANSGGITITAK